MTVRPHKKILFAVHHARIPWQILPSVLQALVHRSHSPAICTHKTESSVHRPALQRYRSPPPYATSSRSGKRQTGEGNARYTAQKDP